jgi:peptidyl-prolyl cis-trans isomerase C
MKTCHHLLQSALIVVLGVITSSATADSVNPGPQPTLAAGASQAYLTVNGKAIPKTRADALAASMPQPRGPQDAEAMRRALGDELVRRELAAQEAVKRGLDSRPDVRAQIDLTVQAVLVSAYLADYAREHPVGDEVLRREYEGIRSTLGNREYKARHILTSTEAEANAIIEKLGRGAKFNELALQSKDRSTKDQGGDLGWVNAATYVRPFAEAIMKLQKGARTLKPVQSEFGWHVIQLDDVRELKVPTLAEVKPQLTQRLQQQIIDRHFTELRAKARIE